MGLRMHIQMTKSVVVCYGELSVVEFSTYDVRAYGASVLAVMLALVVVVFFFFFSSRRRHTRCSRDWFRRVLFRSNLDILERTELVADLLNRFGQPQVRAKECHVDLFEPPNAVIRKALALEPDRVHSEQPGAIPAGRPHERRDVLADRRAPSDHAMGPDADELVDADEPAHDGLIPDRDVAGQGGCIRHDHVGG